MASIAKMSDGSFQKLVDRKMDKALLEMLNDPRELQLLNKIVDEHGEMPKLPEWLDEELNRGVVEFGGLTSWDFSDPSSTAFKFYMARKTRQLNMQFTTAGSSDLPKDEAMKSLSYLRFTEMKIWPTKVGVSLLAAVVLMQILSFESYMQIAEIVKICFMVLLVQIGINGAMLQGESYLKFNEISRKLSRLEVVELQLMASCRKLEMGSTMIAGNSNKQLRGLFEKASFMELRLQALAGAERDAGRMLTQLLCESWDTGAEYLMEGVRREAASWVAARRMWKDCRADEMQVSWEKILKTAVEIAEETGKSWQESATQHNQLAQVKKVKQFFKICEKIKKEPHTVEHL